VDATAYEALGAADGCHEWLTVALATGGSTTTTTRCTVRHTIVVGGAISRGAARVSQELAGVATRRPVDAGAA
jgi:hypothetical protein